MLKRKSDITTDVCVKKSNISNNYVYKYTYYPDKQPKSMTQHFNNTDGPIVYKDNYWPNGNRQFSYLYTKEEVPVIYFGYNKEEKVEWIINYDEDGNISNEKDYYENGNIKKSKVCETNKVIKKEYDEEGSLTKETIFVGGTNKDIPYCETHFENNVKVKDIYFYNDGTKQTESQYNNDDLTKYTCWYENGKVSSCNEYNIKSLGDNVQSVVYYYNTGVMREEACYYNNIITNHLYYYKNGKTKLEMWLNDNDQECFDSYYENGQLKSEKVITQEGDLVSYIVHFPKMEISQ